jgi:four helix bundle protein
MLKTFRTYQLAIQLYRIAVTLRLPALIKKQLLESTSSSAANLAEGHGKSSTADQCRFFEIAFASCKESQAWLDMGGLSEAPAGLLADKLGAHIYRLIAAARR